MLISTRSRYGFRALTQLARAEQGSRISLAYIAKMELIPLRYLEQIFGKLRSAGIVKGRRGPGGGYVLARHSDEICLLEIVNALETDFLPVDCLDDSEECGERTGHGSGNCVLQDRCVTRKLWHTLRTGYRHYLGKHTLEDLSMGTLETAKFPND